MTSRQLKNRRLGALAARGGVIASTVMVVVSALAVLPGGTPTAGAAGTLVGAAQIVTPGGTATGGNQPLNAGGSATPFALLLPGSPPQCPGDSANDGYRVTTFVVPASVDPGTLTFDPSGPIPLDVGANFRQPLYGDGDASAYTEGQTANADTPGGPGAIIEFLTFDLFFSAEFTAAQVPEGDYLLGYACILGVASATQMSSYWVARINVVHDSSDAGGFRWTAVQTNVTTTTGNGGTTTTTSGAGGSTSTTVSGGSTTTTRPGGSTTSTTGSGSTTTTAAAGATTTAAGTSTGGTGPTTTGGALPATGGSPWGLALWSAVLLIVGRIAVVLGRPPKLPASG